MIVFTVLGVLYIAVTMTVGLVSFGMAIRKMPPFQRAISILILVLFGTSATTLGLKGYFHRAAPQVETAKRANP